MGLKMDYQIDPPERKHSGKSSWKKYGIGILSVLGLFLSLITIIAVIDIANDTKPEPQLERVVNTEKPEEANYAVNVSENSESVPTSQDNSSNSNTVVPIVVSTAQSKKVDAKIYEAKVIGVHDGDTIQILKAPKTPIKIRLHGVDAPESNQDFGSKAKEFASKKVFNKNVFVEELDKDRYGRIIALIWLDTNKSDSLNQSLVRNGMAWWYKEYAPKDKNLEKLEKDARKAKIGIWSHPNPIAPWDFRKSPPSKKVTSKSNVSSNDTIEDNSASGSETVYVTKTGDKYHRGSCRYLKKSKIPMSLKDAKESGYSPCSKCY